MTKIKISEVFRTTGQPTITYAKRENGINELQIQSVLNSGGRLCLLTGPSKTGKTTLYKRVIQEINKKPLTIRCDNQLDPESFWKQALETIDFNRISSIVNDKSGEISGEITGKFGWAWLANLIGETKVGVKGSMSESEIREKILAKASPQHLIPILKFCPIVLVVEDFHYLTSECQQTIFQQWKAFIDEEVSVIVVGTTHHAFDLARANKDLVGRIVHIETKAWTPKDLSSIVNQGFEHLGIQDSLSTISTTISNSAVGLPIIVQDVCSTLFTQKGIFEIEKDSGITFGKSDVFQALHSVALTSYSQHLTPYNRLANGPRKKARKYNTYELILMCFAKDPVMSSLDRHEIDKRLKELSTKETLPPAQSINSTLNALENFQSSNKLELLEWSLSDQKLYILDLTFLFYLRWKEPVQHNKPQTLRELFTTLFNFEITFKSSSS